VSTSTTDLARLEAIIDASGAPERIETLLPIGVRPRQLSARTLLLGILLCLADGRPAHLARIHQTLIALPEDEKRRLSVIVRWKTGLHELTYRQIERTYGLIISALAKQQPDGKPSQTLSEIIDRLLEGSITVLGAPRSSALSIDWTDHESFARPPHKDGRCADPEAAWGHRKTNHPGRSETFFGYYLQAATIVKEEGGPEAPELVRRITLASAKHDPPEQIVPVLGRMTEDGISLGDLLADCGYSYRQAESFAMPARALGAALIVDLHPGDRGTKSTHMGAFCANGNLYCPATPKALLELGPLAPAASAEQIAAHDTKTAELARHKLQPISSIDQDGYHRVACPATKGKLRCPLRAPSMSLSHEHPTITSPPEHPPVCCVQQTITVPPSVNAKTAQKHDWPSAAHRRSYTRRTASERSFSQISDPASTDTRRGWSRLTGLTANALLLSCAFIIANIATADAFAARQAEDERRRAHGLPPRRRARRRRSTQQLIAAANAPPQTTA
jgi:hypothetical protein